MYGGYWICKNGTGGFVRYDARVTLMTLMVLNSSVTQRHFSVIWSSGQCRLAATSRSQSDHASCGTMVVL